MLKPARMRRLPWSLKTAHDAARIPRAPITRSFASVQEKPIQKDPTELDQITTLSNGVRVATEALPGHFSGVGVYVDAGSRFENDSLRGVSHIIDRLAFKSTSKRSGDQMLESLESLGGNMHCASSRETLMYQSATFNASVPSAVGLLAETVRDPLVTEEEVAQQLETADYEISEIWSKPELILPELVHVAAYKGNTLGNPLLCPRERLSEINKATVDAYRQAFYSPERMVIAYVGVDHAEAVRLTQQYFGDMASSGPSLPSIGSQTTLNTTSLPQTQHQQQTSTTTTTNSTYTPPQDPTRLLNKIPFLKNLSTSAPHHATPTDLPPTQTTTPPQPQHSHYTGGFLSLDPLPPPPNPALPRLSHIHLAFEALPISSPDIYALAALQTLLGGGGSFSAGGPGKGMYSRLYTNVLNQYAWVESCVAFNHSYTDSGVFGISAACSPGRVSQMLEVICRELAALSAETGFSRLQEEEVVRAKNQLRSSLLMNLESRMVELEDLGRQIQCHGRKIGVREMCERIENLSVGDLRRVAGSVVKGLVGNPGAGAGTPTVVLQEGEEEGRVLRPFEWGEIQERIGRWKLGRM